MNYQNPSLSEESASNSAIGVKTSLITLYEQHAAGLLGVITKILQNEGESIQVLEDTFIKAQTCIDEFQTGKQPTFAWLLKTARDTASGVLKKRLPVETSIIQLTLSGQATLISPQKHSLSESTLTADRAQLKQFLNAVMFENCTPEEAADSLGLPVGLARQQLRLAIKQLRTSTKFE